MMSKQTSDGECDGLVPNSQGLLQSYLSLATVVTMGIYLPCIPVMYLCQISIYRENR